MDVKEFGIMDLIKKHVWNAQPCKNEFPLRVKSQWNIRNIAAGQQCEELRL